MAEAALLLNLCDDGGGGCLLQGDGGGSCLLHGDGSGGCFILHDDGSGGFSAMMAVAVVFSAAIAAA
eukprot:14212058-Ditylum_brightwellii.AAC.1